MADLPQGFVGYESRTAADPDVEIITTASDTGGAAAAPDLIRDQQNDQHSSDVDQQSGNDDRDGGGERRGNTPPVDEEAGTDERSGRDDRKPALGAYGDPTYGRGEFRQRLNEGGINSRCKTEPPIAAAWRFSRDFFDVGGAAGRTGWIGPTRGRDVTGAFGLACTHCLLRACVTTAAGRTITIGRYEQALLDARAQQGTSALQADYQATRPTIER